VIFHCRIAQEMSPFFVARIPQSSKAIDDGIFFQFPDGAGDDLGVDIPLDGGKGTLQLGDGDLALGVHVVRFFL